MRREQTLESLFNTFKPRGPKSPSFAFSGFRSLKTPQQGRQNEDWEAIQKYRKILEERDEVMEHLNLEFQRARHAVDELQVAAILLGAEIRSRWKASHDA